MVREIYGSDRRAHYDANTHQHAHFICSASARSATSTTSRSSTCARQGARRMRGHEQRVEFTGSAPAAGTGQGPDLIPDRATITMRRPPSTVRSLRHDRETSGRTA